MRIAITGATGFLGGALARALVDAGEEVHALRRPGSAKVALDGAVTWHEGDVTVPASLPPFLAGADALVHAAGMLGRAGAPEAAYRALNAGGTRNVLAAAPERCRVLLVSSPGVLGPIDGEPADEEAPLAPSNPYERSKAEAERIGLDAVEAGRTVVIARPEFVYGPGDRHVLGLFRAIQRGRFFYLGGGRRSCHPTFVEDAVDGMLRCLRAGRAGERYHLAGPRPVTFRELGEAIADALGVRAPWLDVPAWVARPGASACEVVARVTGLTAPIGRTTIAFFTEDRRFSWKKAHDELGFSPGCDVRDGARRTVAWYRAQGWL